MTSRRLASIDLGTNTVRLLVIEVDAAGDWKILDQDQRVTRLGEGLGPAGKLGEVPMDRTAAVVAEYVKRAAAAGASRTWIVATSAVREATNGAAYAAQLERRTGCRVWVVSGQEEARLTVRGILKGLGPGEGPLLAFDIGGGSTEYILARGGQVEAVASLALGVVGLAERFPFPGPVDRPRYRRMEEEIRAQLLRELPPSIRAAAVSEIVGTAGTVTTLAALDLGLIAYDPLRVQGHRLDRAAVERLRERLGALTVEARGRLPCLEPGRADLIIPGAAIVLATLDVLGAGTVVVSDWGLREGIMAEAIEPPAEC